MNGVNLNRYQCKQQTKQDKTRNFDQTSIPRQPTTCARFPWFREHGKRPMYGRFPLLYGTLQTGRDGAAIVLLKRLTAGG